MLKRFLIYLKDIRKIQFNSTPLPSYWAFCLIKILLQLLTKDYGIFPGSMQTPGSFLKTRISNPPKKQQPKRCADITGRSWQQGRSIVTGSTAGKRQRLMTPPLTQLGHISFSLFLLQPHCSKCWPTLPSTQVPRPDLAMTPQLPLLSLPSTGTRSFSKTFTDGAMTPGHQVYTEQWAQRSGSRLPRPSDSSLISSPSSPPSFLAFKLCSCSLLNYSPARV